ncbi:hypothetical protein J6590_024255 [Homalodisca vitripennis]|nr:hypothetical protein J6590_024255 [Homalodisca vitripennis]
MNATPRHVVQANYANSKSPAVSMLELITTVPTDNKRVVETELYVRQLMILV